MPKLQQVIIAEELRGDGRTEPVREVTVVYDVDGKLIAERDTFRPSPRPLLCMAQHPEYERVRCGRPVRHDGDHRNHDDTSVLGYAWQRTTPDPGGSRD